MGVLPITHRQRLENCLSGAPLDRVPVALWRHFPVDDQRPDRLAQATAWFQRQFDFDLIKISPSSSFCLSDWGVSDVWTGNPEGSREYNGSIIHQPEDWARLPLLDPRQGALGAQLDCVRLIQKVFSPHTPIIQTVFNPLAQAKNLMGREGLINEIRNHPQEIKAGLEIITQTTLRFIEALVEMKIDGVFYAVQHAQSGLLSNFEFEEFSLPYDLRILEAARPLWLNMAHIHGKKILFDTLAKYPVQILNWHDRETFPSLPEGQRRFNGVVCGGLRQWDTLVLGTPEQVTAEGLDALESTGGKRFILGTGCVTPVTAPYGNLLAARQVIEPSFTGA